MYLDLKRDILKILSKGERKESYSLKGIDGLEGDDLNNLLKLCNLYEREGDLGNYRDIITHKPMIDVLVKYKMW